LQLTSFDFFLLFCASFLLTSQLTPAVRVFALKFGVTDSPTQAHKTHKEPVPYLGGVAIIVGTIATTFGSAVLTDFTQQTLLLASTILIPALLMSIVGLIDDIKQLKPWPRFVAQNAIALVSATILVKTDTLGAPFGVLALDFAVTMLWLVGITNSINFFDNIDGGSSGAIAISSVALTLIAVSNGQILIGAMSAVLAGSAIGFLIWNKPPARIYMGDAGALFLGILIATLTIRLDSNEELGTVGVFIPFLLLAIPILDTTVAVTKRIYRRLSPFQGGRDHLSHRLMRLGLKKRSTVLTLWLLSVVFSILAVMLSKNHSSDAVVTFGGVLWSLLLVFFLYTEDEN
jgi:UDP-GlcNAc:undecaprenyl-phosphate GlcNAc-1-phosphate transferase